MTHQDELLLSHLLGASLADAAGAPAGRVRDVVANPDAAAQATPTQPAWVITGVVVGSWLVRLGLRPGRVVAVPGDVHLDADGTLRLDAS